MRNLFLMWLSSAVAWAQIPTSKDFAAMMEESRLKQRDECHAQVAKGSFLHTGPEACFCLDNPKSTRCKNYSPSPFAGTTPAYPDEVRRTRPSGPAAPGARPRRDPGGIALAPGEVLRFAPARTAVLLGFRPSALSDSPLVRALLAPFMGEAVTQLAPQVRGVEQVYLSISAPQAGGQPDVVLVAQGDFSQGVPPFLVPGGNAMASVWVNRRTIVLGSETSAAAAYDRLSAKGPPTVAMAMPANEWMESDVWLSADFSRLRGGIAPATTALGDVKDLRTMALQLSLKGDLAIKARVGTATPAVAAKLLLAVKDALARDAWRERVDITADGTNVRVTALVKKAEIEAAMTLARISSAEGAAAARALPPRPMGKPTVWGSDASK